MDLIHLCYASHPFGFDNASFNGIISGARRNNARDSITGALISRADIYLQFLEGPEAAVEATFGRILVDDRHVEIVRLFAGPSSERRFPGWAMRDDPARSWLWNQAEIAGGAIGRATRDDILGVFDRMAAEPD